MFTLLLLDVVPLIAVLDATEQSTIVGIIGVFFRCHVIGWATEMGVAVGTVVFCSGHLNRPPMHVSMAAFTQR